jgi:DNA-binding response OmpR family regulator
MGQRILVVDDEEQMRQLLSLYLSKQGYRVSTAASSAEALQQIAQTPFHLVVVDIGLANEDGLHLLAYLKAEHPKLRVVMLTGMGFMEELLQEANQKGADGYVSKGLPLQELHLAIQNVLNRSHTST